MRRRTSSTRSGRTRGGRGAGGVPVRSADDYRSLYAASRRGNYPLMRTYSGTDDFVRLAEMYVETINIAWAAVPLFWFNAMDGRGPHDLETSIRLHQELMAWYGARGIPVELNEPHHWGMRDAPDVVFVVAAYLSAYNARAFGVHDYIAQMMFNSPPGLSDAMDLAKMLACLELIEPLAERRDLPSASTGRPASVCSAIRSIPRRRAGIWPRPPICRWRSSRTSCTWSATPRRTMRPRPRM